jgi:hypothetical protein
MELKCQAHFIDLLQFAQINLPDCIPAASHSAHEVTGRENAQSFACRAPADTELAARLSLGKAPLWWICDE